MKANVYLGFNGQCEEAFNFYRQVLGGEIVMMMKHKDLPDPASVPAAWSELVMHARLVSGDVLLMGSDWPPDRFEGQKGFHVSLIVDGPDEANRVFEALSEGATITMPIAKTFWAERFGMLTDKFGTPWMVNSGNSIS